VRDARSRNFYRWIVIAIACVLFLFFYIDDWSRDFSTNHAEISSLSTDPSLQPFESTRSKAELIEGVTWAAHRIRSWEYVGEAGDGKTTRLIFVQTHRLLRFKDDITVAIEDQGNRRVITAESRSRLDWGDLGRNPRNLRRLLDELSGVLDG
jgi:uncharacterized protein (DUF1499 family)